MGLDCFWKNAEGQTAKVDREFDICGGMLSDHGSTSFRGKVYNDLVEQASEISLYQETIDNATCLKISNCLDNFDFRHYRHAWYPIDRTEFEEFKEMFRIHSQLGHSLHGWWQEVI